MDVINEVAFTEDEVNELKRCFEQYAFYTKTRTRVRWYCSSCDQWHEENYMDDALYHEPIRRECFKQNEYLDCPYCGQRVVSKSINKGFGTLACRGCFVICRNIDGRFRMLATKVMQTFEQDCTRELKAAPQYLYEFDNQGRLHKFSWRWNGHWSWKENKTVTPFPHDSYLYNYGFDSACLINPQTIRETAQRYSGAEDYVTSDRLARKFVEYLCLYNRHPNVEYIQKQHFYKVMGSLMDKTQDTVYVNWRSNNLLKMLGIRSKDDIESCKQMSPHQLQLYRKLSKKYPHMAELALKIPPGSCPTFLSIYERTGLSPTKIHNYLIKHKESITYWRDYLRMAQQIYNNDFEMRPKNLAAAHDRCVDILNARKEEDQRKFNAARTKKLQAFVYQEEGLTIVLPQSVKDIVDEGKALAHCVGGYAERHFKGQTTILFLRKTEEPDKPYYTMELNKTGKIVQCRGYRNNNAGNPKPQEIKTFEQHYEQYLQEVIHGKRNKRAVQQGV